jgi:16S rRNA (cytosine967-C5)-methyltransferase
LNTEAPVYLRANRLKVTPEELVRELGREDIAASAAGPDGVMLARRSNVFLSRSFHAGLFEVQDLHSQLVARALEPRAGERVIDACAGGGGKSLHLAALMGGKGKVLAMDVAEGKLTRLRERANRAGASCIETRVIDGAKVIKRLADSADRLLLDVPCSGLGVWRRNPDGKWRLTAEEIARLKGVQAEILSRYAAMLKPGGLMVYATCSILPDENERQIENFLSHNGNGWELLDQRSLRPAPGGGDGFFVARLRRRS